MNLYCNVDYTSHEFMSPLPINVYWGGLPFSGWDFCWGWWHKNYGKKYGKFSGYKQQTPVQPCPGPVMGIQSLRLLLNISNLTWLVNSSWVQELSQSGLHPLLLAERGPLSPHWRVEINFLMACGIIHARMNHSWTTLSSATQTFPGEYSKLFCAVINKVTVIIREMQWRPRQLLFFFCIEEW